MRSATLLSSGIDSPVAAYMISGKVDVNMLVHMDTRPYADERSIEKVKDVVKVLREVTKMDLQLWALPFGEVFHTRIEQLKDPHLRCVHCKRGMLLTASQFAKVHELDIIITGDSMGQVASQTLQNLKMEQEIVSVPVIRPLIGLDKEEIINISRSIGTFDISSKDIGGCKMAPTKPVVGAGHRRVIENELSLDMNALARECVEKAVTL